MRDIGEENADPSTGRIPAADQFYHLFQAVLETATGSTGAGSLSEYMRLGNADESKERDKAAEKNSTSILLASAICYAASEINEGMKELAESIRDLREVK